MRHKGFTLIEAILTASLLAAGILGLLTLFQQNVGRSDEMEQTVIASLLAQERIEQIIHNKKYQGYANITAANYAGSENLASIGYPGYTRTTTIQEVSGNDLTTPQNGSGYTRITVTVTPTGGQAATYQTLVTYWGEL